MAVNRFTNREGANSEFPNQINEREFISKYLLKEFPNDPVLQDGKLKESDVLPTKPVTGLAKRNLGTSLLEIDADVSASYAEYNINKLVPGIDDEELDEVLDDEFEFYIDPEDARFRTPVRTGLFLVNIELDSEPFDFHDAYINSGPEQIPALIDAGMPEDTLFRNIFCIWFIDRDIARPIPNYKTLEVMLVERGLTYGDIGEADETQSREFDMKFDGIGVKFPDEDEFGNEIEGASIFDEFISRTVLDRSKDWSPTIRFKSGYRPGDTESGEPFLRDPGDYIKPEQLRSQATYIPELDATVNARRARLIAARRIELEGNNISDSELAIEFEDLVDPLENHDPDDRYFDNVFITSRLERLRAEYEGKLILLQWPGSPFRIDVVENFTDNVLSDDLIFDLRFMIHGHLKQVLSLRTLKEIARMNNIDTSGYDPVNEELPVGLTNGSEEFQRLVEEADEEQYTALREQSGFINIMVENGGITVLGDQRAETGTRAIWDDFGQIAQIDRLDFQEYTNYVTFYSNNLNPFGITELNPYEPAGSIVYYPPKRFDQLQRQAVAQGQFDQAKRAIEEMFPPVAARAAELSSRLSGLQTGFAQYCQDAFGSEADVHQILFNTQTSSGKSFELFKRKNNGRLKSKGRQDAFFKLCEVEFRILGSSMNKSSENKIFLPNRNKSSAWFINTNDKDDYNRAQALLATRNSNGLVLCDDRMADAMKKARRGTTPKYKESDDGSAGNNKQRYARPEKGGSRVRQQMKDPYYFRAGVAQYILEFIIDPKQYQSSVQGFPEDLINGKTDADLYTLCVDADNFLSEIVADIEEITTFISEIDELILQADSVEALLSIETRLRNGKSIVEDFNDELFTYLESLQAYIEDSRKELMQRIVNAIQYVRKKVNNKNRKYYIEWAPENAFIAQKYGVALETEHFKPS
jgi:hypothetical protein